MSPTIINVNLYSESKDDDTLSFSLCDYEGKIELNSDSCQLQMKEVFSRLINLAVDHDVQLKLLIDDNYSRQLYIDVCKEYIGELQKELDNVTSRIRRELKNI